jgi:hypothetical protein
MNGGAGGSMEGGTLKAGYASLPLNATDWT